MLYTRCHDVIVGRLASCPVPDVKSKVDTRTAAGQVKAQVLYIAIFLKLELVLTVSKMGQWMG